MLIRSPARVTLTSSSKARSATSRLRSIPPTAIPGTSRTYGATSDDQVTRVLRRCDRTPICWESGRFGRELTVTGLRGVDLNLLVALDALLEERNLTRAGERINMTQPAMSGALTRLRRHFGDELIG